MATEAYIDGNKINDERPLAVQAQGGTDAIGGILVVLVAQYAPAWIASIRANVRMWRKPGAKA